MNRASTILIVDDDAFVRDMLKSLLVEQHYNLAFAGNGEEALKKARDLTPDLVLLDVVMPGMDGFEVCQRLRSDPLLAEVPVVMVTGMQDRDSRLRGIEAGADDFLGKPFDQTELLARVRTITRLNRYRRLRTANQQLENKVNRLTALYEISSTLSSSVDIDVLLRSIVQKTKDLLNVEGASVILWDEQRDELYFPSVAAEEAEVEKQLKRIHFPTNQGIAGWVFHKGEPALVSDVSSDERFYREVDDDTRFLTKSILCVPLRGKENTLGVLEAVNKGGGDFSQDDQTLLQAMADNIAVSIEKASLYRDLQRAEALLRRQNAELKRAVRQKYRFDNIVGNSKRLIDILKRAEQVALTDSTVLIYGETGTGKDLLARAIHQSSPRSMENFIPINCGAIPENLLESELFGHEKGAFTSADARRIGRFEEANGGTIFLDEIGDMPMNLQVRLLRVLQEGVVQRLGNNQEITVDVRLIAATHQNLVELVAKEKFRQDLYYRLKVFELELPPLRVRKEDIPLLIDHFIRYYNDRLGKKVVGVDDDVLNALCEYDYPGNIRELQHIVESTMILCKDSRINIGLLTKDVLARVGLDRDIDVAREIPAIPRNNEELKAIKAKERKRAEERVERMFLTELLSKFGGNISEAARQSGMNRSWLAQLVSRNRLNTEHFRNNVS